MKFLDTNIFIRYLADPVTGEDRRTYLACAALFEHVASGIEPVTTSETIIHEVLYVLCSPRIYALSHADAVARLRPVIHSRSLTIHQKDRIEAAADLFATYQFIDFADAIGIVHAHEDSHDYVSYDRALDRIPGVNRQEP